MSIEPDWKSQSRSPEDVAALVENHARVFVHGASATPTPLLDALSERDDLEGAQLYHLHLAGECRFTEPGKEHGVYSNSLFVGPQLRKPVAEGRADFVPIFLSEIPSLFTSGRVPLDVAILQLSTPDRHGFCTLGPSVDAAKAAADSARIILAEINEQMPRTHGNTVVPFDRVTAFTHTDRPLHQLQLPKEGPVEARIGELVAALVEDGATLQMGIGGIPDAALARLTDKNDLGVHSEMFSDRLIDLIENGNVNNSQKNVHRHRTVTSFVSGTQRLFDFVNDNMRVEFHPCDRTNDTAHIARNPKVVAINSALQIDMTGQICADSIGHRIYSGIGGQMDFMRGAARSKGGKPIIALPSTAAKGTISRITPTLTPGAGVVTTRGHVHWVVTEHGAVNLHGMPLRKRAEMLISIAHPDFRAELKKELAEVRHFPLG